MRWPWEGLGRALPSPPPRTRGDTGLLEFGFLLRFPPKLDGRIIRCCLPRVVRRVVYVGDRSGLGSRVQHGLLLRDSLPPRGFQVGNLIASHDNRDVVFATAVQGFVEQCLGGGARRVVPAQN